MVRRRAISVVAFIILAIVALVGTNPLDTYFANLGDRAPRGDLIMQFVIVGICAILLFAQVEYAGTRPPMTVPWTITVVLAYCLLSMVWAIDPLIGFRRLTLTAMVIWIIVRCVGDLGVVRTLNLMRGLLAVVMLANYAAVIFTPYGVHGMSFDEADAVFGDWRGVFGHKNTAGAAVAVTILLFLFDRRQMPVWVSALVVLPSLYFLYKTGSRTSMAALSAALLVGVLTLGYNARRRGLVLPVLALGVSVAVLALVMLSPTIQVMLDDPRAFTGRSRIWQLLLIYAREHLWTGAGFGSFWSIGPSSPIFRLTDDWVSRYVPHAHNGYLDLLVTIGLPGLIVTIALVLIWPPLKLLLSWQVSGQRRAVLLSILIFCMVHNLAESSLLNRTSMVEFFLILSVVLMHRIADQSEGRHQHMQMWLEDAITRRGVRRFSSRFAHSGNLNPVRRSGSGRLAVLARSAGVQTPPESVREKDDRGE
ncbi:exopolysaccharide production protein [Novosphingobium sp. Rr 2-17]|nr:exopolysaccharide production protein [Novosphingobium sp. Rr 2-17]